MIQSSFLNAMQGGSMNGIRRFALVVLMYGAVVIGLQAQDTNQKTELDNKVSAFLESRKNGWHDMNVPDSDGKALYDLIVRNGYTRALEIGTSTGRSGIWIAWALSRTGGKLITIEIDEGRHRQALENFRRAGLSEFIDARLGDAHEIVPTLKGPFDFVFSDADKEWYRNYFTAVFPKLTRGGCFTAHNTSNPYGGIRDFLDYVKSLPNVETSEIRSSRSGISVSIKKSD
jgi:caffeoyl-CoA O-methyltransferase